MKQNSNSFKSIRLLMMPMMFFAFVSNSCKKEILPSEVNDPNGQKLINALKSKADVHIVNFAQFMNKVNINRLGILKTTFIQNSGGEKLMGITTEETYKGFAVNTDSINVLKVGDHTSFVFKVKLSHKRSTSFQNLTIEESPQGTKAFVTTYFPSKKWIANYRLGKKLMFEGDIKFTSIDLGNPPSTPTSYGFNPQKLSSLSPNKLNTQQLVCDVFSIWVSIPYQCSGEMRHWPGESCPFNDNPSQGSPPGIMYLPMDVQDCYYINNNPNGGPGGNTTPELPGGYNPCDGLGGGGNNQFVPGTKLLVLPPDDCPPGNSESGDPNQPDPTVIPEDPMIPYEDHDTVDPKKLMKCFNSIPNTGASYQVILQVQEPVPGTALPWGIPNGVGHTAITMIKTGADGTKVTQTLGFYPSGNKFSSVSRMVDNGADGDEMKATISLTANISAENFQEMIDAMSTPPGQYGLLGMNCTMFACSALMAADISIPSPFGTVAYTVGPAVTAATPGALGYAMRQAKANGDNRINTNTTYAPKSKGSCN